MTRNVQIDPSLIGAVMQGSPMAHGINRYELVKLTGHLAWVSAGIGYEYQVRSLADGRVVWVDSQELEIG